MTPATKPCRHRTINNAHGDRCHHPRVVVPGGRVTADTCNACRVRDEPLPQGNAVRGRETRAQLSALDIPPGPRAVYRCDVVMPYYKNLQWVPAAIDSILWQQSVEPVLHLVNDDSPEDDAWLKRKYAGHSNIRWYRNRENLGPYAAVHQVWRWMETPFLAIQDSDDLALPHRLWFSIHALEAEAADIFGGAMEQFLDPGVPPDDELNRGYVERIPVERSGRPARDDAPPFIVNGTMVVRRTAFEVVNGFASFRCGSDLEFAARAHRAGLQMLLLNRVVGLRRVNSDSLSRGGEHGVATANQTRVAAELRRRYQLYAAADEFDPRPWGCLDAAELLTDRVAPPCQAAIEDTLPLLTR